MDYLMISLTWPGGEQKIGGPNLRPRRRVCFAKFQQKTDPRYAVRRLGSLGPWADYPLARRAARQAHREHRALARLAGHGHVASFTILPSASTMQTLDHSNDTSIPA